jgi:hypothetical protein
MNWMQKAIILCVVFVLGLLTSLLVEVQTVKAQYTPDEQLSATISPSPATTIDLGQQVQFTASVSDGAPPFSYQWYSNDNPVADATFLSFMFASTLPGAYNISVIVKDSLNTQASSNATSVTVNPWLSVHVETRSATTYVNQPVQFTAFVSGGTPPYRYQWHSRLYPDGEPVAGATSPSFTFTPTSPGKYVIDLTATDSLNAQAGYLPPPITVTVLATPTPSQSPTPTPTPSSTPTPTSTPLPSPTPMPLFDGSMTSPIIATVATVIVVAIAALVLFRKQRYGSIEKPTA